MLSEGSGSWDRGGKRVSGSHVFDRSKAKGDLFAGRAWAEAGRGTTDIPLMRKALIGMSPMFHAPPFMLMALGPLTCVPSTCIAVKFQHTQPSLGPEATSQ